MPHVEGVHTPDTHRFAPVQVNGFSGVQQRPPGVPHETQVAVVASQVVLGAEHGPNGEEAQHGCPRPPHATQLPATQLTPLRHSPAQHGSPASPHAFLQVPPEQRPVPSQYDPGQHGSPSAPHDVLHVPPAKKPPPPGIGSMEPNR